MKFVIFACVHGAGRSQMAAAFFNGAADSTQARAVSAGTRPADGVHTEVVAAMKEIGIDLSVEKPRLLTPELAAEADLLVTMGCDEKCPFVPGLRRVDWALDDPRGQTAEKVGRIRDDIRERVERLVEAEGWRARRQMETRAAG